MYMSCKTMKVYLETTASESTGKLFLSPTAFLVLLATRWRVGELHTCVRDAEFCRFTEDGTLLIRPHHPS